MRVYKKVSGNKSSATYLCHASSHVLPPDPWLGLFFWTVVPIFVKAFASLSYRQSKKKY
jgi:hypothetical protein